jgi:type IV pilus assembly protein PilC
MDINESSSKNGRKIAAVEWNGVNKQGNKVSGVIKNISIKKARTQLTQRGVTKIKIKEKQSSVLNFSFQSINKGDIAGFTRQIATMIKAGLPIIQAFEIIEKGIEKEVFKELITNVKTDIQQGMSLTEAFSQHPKYFDELYCSLVAAGEKSGALDILLDRIATFIEKSEDIKNKVKKAMYYPVAVMTISLIVTSILLLKVVPQFESVFQGFGAELPAFTQIIIKLSDFMQESFFHLVASTAIGIYLFNRAIDKSSKLKMIIDSLKLKLPIIGKVVQKAIIARFSRTLSTTFAAGVPLVKALQFTAGASGNQKYIQAILKIKEQVESGTSFTNAIEETGLFPILSVQMISAGESSGMLPEMLDKFAKIYETEVDDIVGGLSSLIEPIVISILGLLVGGLIIAMYLPIFQLGSLV